MLEILEKIKASKAFKDWKHPKAYLCSVFITENEPQFSFYDKKTKLVTSFAVKEGKVALVTKDDKVFQKEKQDLKEIHPDEIRINMKQAKEIADSLQKEKYPRETVSKEIFILQHIGEKLVWNITKITAAFNIINIKISAIDGKILEDIITPALSFKERK
jgi:hypothetical protein